MGRSQTAGARNLVRVVAISLAAGAIFLIAISYLGQRVADQSAEPVFRWLIALTGVGLTALVVIVMRSLGRMDELERGMHTEAMAFAFLCSILFVAAYVYVSAAGLGTPPVYWLLPAMMGSWAVGVMLAFRRYR